MLLLQILEFPVFDISSSLQIRYFFTQAVDLILLLL